MATSGITIYQLTRDDVIQAALRKLVTTAEGATPTAAQVTTAAAALNNIIVEFNSLGMQLWERKQLAITMVTAQTNYTIGVGQTINNAYPVHLLQATLQVPTAGNQINLNILPSQNFNMLPTLSTGTPVNVRYQPYINYGVLSVWPTPDASVPSGTTITIEYTAPLEIFNSSTDTPDLPQEWANALIYQLARVLSDEYALPIMEKQWIKSEAEAHLAVAMSNGGEDGSFYIQPDWNGMR